MIELIPIGLINVSVLAGGVTCEFISIEMKSSQGGSIIMGFYDLEMVQLKSRSNHSSNGVSNKPSHPKLGQTLYQVAFFYSKSLYHEILMQ